MFENIKVPRQCISGTPHQQEPFDEQGADITDIKQCRAMLSSFQEYLTSCFIKGYEVSALLECRTRFLDHLLSRLFKHFKLNESGSIALIAVGGYGRGEMFLESDIDILLVADIDEIPQDIG